MEGSYQCLNKPIAIIIPTLIFLLRSFSAAIAAGDKAFIEIPLLSNDPPGPSSCMLSLEMARVV